MSQQKLALFFALALGACTSSNARTTGGGGGGGKVDMTASSGEDLAGSTDDGSTLMSIDFAGIDGGGSAYGDLSTSSGCTAGQTGMTCATGLPARAGCGAVEICGNGLDDDCDGYVDGYPPTSTDSCPCTPGAVQKCFLGPPEKRGVGACTDGSQTCQGNGEFGIWGPCMGSIGPEPETCDKLDNDCNGCADDGLCCNTVLDCPAPGDPRIAPIAPYTDLALKGELFFTGAATTWSWTVSGGPCDQLFASAAFTPKKTPPVQSFTLTNANTKDATVHFTLSGDYTITMTVVENGVTSTCKWVQHVQGPGVRFELCWDHQGSKAQGGADLDLHVHQSGNTTAWSDSKADCFFDNCTAADYWLGGAVNWGYTQTPLINCSGAKNGADWKLTPGKDCYSPRLDNDNIDMIGIAENTNIDTPKAGDSFRSMVHFYSSFTVTEHPMVNIYCGGNLLATFGQAPNQLTGFTTGAGDPTKGQMWRVADVAPTVDATGVTTGCTITAIHPPSTTSGFYITTDDTTF